MYNKYDKLKTIFVIYFTVSFSCIASAQHLSCSNLFSKTEIQLEIADKNFVDNKTPKNLLNQANQMLNDLFPLLQLPQKVTIHLSPLSSEPTMEYKPEQNLWNIYIGERYFFNPILKYPTHPIHSRAIFAHEFGHIAFNYSFLSKYNQFKEYDLLNAEYSKARKSFNQLHTPEGRPNPKHYQTSEEFDEAYQKYYALTRKTEKDMNFYSNLIELSEQKFANRKLTTLKRAYDELFADTIAVLFTSNPHAISEALKFTAPWNIYTRQLVTDAMVTNPKRFYKRTRQVQDKRDSTLNNRDFDSRNKEVSDDFDLIGSENYHSVFAETRDFLWSHFLKYSYYQNRKHIVVKVLLDVFLSEIDYYYNTILSAPTETKINQINIQEMNDRLQRALSQALTNI